MSESRLSVGSSPFFLRPPDDLPFEVPAEEASAVVDEFYRNGFEAKQDEMCCLRC